MSHSITKKALPNRSVAAGRLRKSTAVPLVLAASTVLSSCSKSYHQDEYASFNDCTKDWERPELCQARQTGSSSTSTSGGSGSSSGWRYYGPSYEEGQRDALQRNVRGQSGFNSAKPTSNHSIGRSVSRGGFGGSGHSGSSGG